MDSDKTRILIVVPRFHTNLEPIVKGFVSKGFKVSVFPWRSSMAEIRLSSTELKFCDSDIRKTFRVFGKKMYIYRVINMYRLFREEKRETIKVFLRAELSFFGVTSLMWILILRIRKTLTVFTQYPIKNPRFHQQIWHFLLKRILKVRVFSQVYESIDTNLSEFSTLNEYSRWLELLEIDSPEYIPFATPDVNPMNMIKFKQIVSVGKAQERKGFFEIAVVFRELSHSSLCDYTLIFVFQVRNDNEREFLEVMKTSFSDLLIAKRLVILCNLSVEETRKTIESSQFLVLNSRSEPASFVQVESLSLEVPFVIKRSNGSSFLLPNNWGIMKVYSKKELYDALNYMVENIEKVSEEIVGVRAIFKDKFSPESIAERWLE